MLVGTARTGMGARGDSRGEMRLGMADLSRLWGEEAGGPTEKGQGETPRHEANAVRGRNRHREKERDDDSPTAAFRLLHLHIKANTKKKLTPHTAMFATLLILPANSSLDFFTVQCETSPTVVVQPRDPTPGVDADGRAGAVRGEACEG